MNKFYIYKDYFVIFGKMSAKTIFNNVADKYDKFFEILHYNDVFLLLFLWTLSSLVCNYYTQTIVLYSGKKILYMTFIFTHRIGTKSISQRKFIF